jgi:hypothetical protein
LVTEIINTRNDETISSIADTAVLEMENLALRRSIAAYKANATRRVGIRDYIRSLENYTTQIEEENAALSRSIAAYKANATRRARNKVRNG